MAGGASGREVEQVRQSVRAWLGAAFGAPPPSQDLDENGWAYARGVGVAGLVRRAVEQAGGRLVPSASNVEAARDLRAALQVDLDRRALSRLLTDAGIPHVWLKGAVSDHALHGGIGARQTCDLDVWIQPADEPAARRALLRAGYAEVMFAGHRLRKRLSKERLWTHPGRMPVDLHVRLVDSLLPRAPHDMWQRALALRARAPMLEPCDALLYTAANWAGGGFDGTEKLAADGMALWRSVDWCEIERRLARWPVQRALWIFLDTIRTQFLDPVPMSWIETLQPPPGHRAVLRRAVQKKRSTLHQMTSWQWALNGRATWPIRAIGTWGLVRLGDGVWDHVSLRLARDETS